MKKQLSELNLLNKDGELGWQNHTIYLWKDIFPAKMQHYVKHIYSPAHGFQYIGTKIKNQQPQKLEDIVFYEYIGLSWNKFCTSSSFEKKLVENYIPSLHHDAREVQYILKTGANWHGPIKHFHLEIIPPKNYIASFCPPKDAIIKELEDGKITCDIENFTPEQDLDIIFVNTKPAE